MRATGTTTSIRERTFSGKIDIDHLDDYANQPIPNYTTKTIQVLTKLPTSAQL
ncbi:MAG: hypothetical protein IPQ18_08865 [Saprospiraceae bacterium]|nr:hypothetical protein [Saprospiraceae bacterium]